MSSLQFNINAKDGNARTGTLTTKNGIINTPAFMPVGTSATVKAIFPEAVKDLGADIILGNTYHLMLAPTAELIADQGGLHKFMNWNKPILTDSGGFQVMSLSQLREISEEGVKFKSHRDGSSHFLTAERSIEIQHLLGSDISMIFDECPSYPISERDAKTSMELSLRWAERSKKAFKAREGYGLFAIVQGSTYKNLRNISAKELTNMMFDGYAIGGLAVGEGHQNMVTMVEHTVPLLPEDKPHYLMGVGKPIDIISAVYHGIDMFDCVIPTRSGRNAQAFVRSGTINVKNAQYKTDKTALDSKCLCYCCRNYSRAYLNHLFKVKEILGPMLLTLHNLHYYQDLMKEIRYHIKNKSLSDYYQEQTSLHNQRNKINS
jgi:queuine tRNA-ribosyltransferase